MRPLVVRLPNWVGDVVMALPALEHLQASGFAPVLVGKGWARALLAGHGWPVHPHRGTLRERITLLRRLGRALRADGAGLAASDADRAGIDALLLTNSFSSALEARLAGLRALGFATDGRRWLLARAVARDPGPAGEAGTATRHESARFWRLATGLTGRTLPPPGPARLRVAADAQARADALIARHVGALPFACIVPFATGLLDGRSKAWCGFAELTPMLLPRLPVVVLPGPGEEADARRHHPQAIAIEGADLGVYAGVLARARLVIANDTGPGHMAAALGVPTVSVLGPTDAARYGARGDEVHLLQQDPWPSVASVAETVDALLAKPPSPLATAPERSPHHDRAEGPAEAR